MDKGENFVTIRYGYIIPALCLMLAGCQTSSVMPDQADVANSASSSASQDPVSNVSAPAPVQPALANNSPGARRADNVAYLSGQLSTMQEQVIQIKADTAELKQTAQVLLARMQMLSSVTATATAQQPSDKPLTDVPAIDSDSLDQLTAQLNNFLKRTNTNYKLVSGYTANGIWVLIRYDRFTGESWLADQGRWNLITESEEVAPSVFDIQLLRADKDIKGYVAARIDQASGQSWWLKEDVWLMFQ
jgi:hypothetical protein